MKERKYNPACVEDEVSISDMLSEELDIVTEPMDYFSLFFNDELLNNTVVVTNRYARHKISELSLARDPFGVGGLMCQFLKCRRS
jgi:hypothetical protein